MDVGALMSIEMRQPIDHSQRLLGGGGVIEPDQRQTIHTFRKYRKVSPDGVYIKQWMRIEARMGDAARRLLLEGIEKIKAGTTKVARHSGMRSGRRRRQFCQHVA